MSASEKSRRQHKWTAFEKHTLLCLIAKNMHTSSTQINTKKDLITLNTSKSHTCMDVTTTLNGALHGMRYEQDIPYDNVRDMIDRLLEEKKGVIGPGGSTERMGGGRVTRARKLAWDRTDRRDFLGSLEEWSAGRRYKVMNEYRKERGLEALEEMKEVEDVPDQNIRPVPRGRSAARTASTSDGAQDVREGQLASSNRIPVEQRFDPKFSWRFQSKDLVTRGPTLEGSVLDDFHPSARTRRYQSERTVRAKVRFAERESSIQGRLSACEQQDVCCCSPVTETATPGNYDVVDQTAVYVGFIKENEMASARNLEVSLSMEGVAYGEKSFGTALANKSRVHDIEDGEIEWG